MADPFVGEIRIFGFNFAPRDWSFCDGALLPIQQYTALFSLLGVQYGGDGKTNFALPDFRGRAALGSGEGPGLTERIVGEPVGTEAVTLTLDQIPAHVHMMMGATTTGASQRVAKPTSTTMFSNSTPGQAYSNSTTPLVPFSPKAIGVTGGNMPHPNAQPRLSLNFCICLRGIFPARN